MMIAQEQAEELARAVRFPAASSVVQTDAAHYLQELQQAQLDADKAYAAAQSAVASAQNALQTAQQAVDSASASAETVAGSVSAAQSAATAAERARTVQTRLRRRPCPVSRPRRAARRRRPLRRIWRRSGPLKRTVRWRTGNIRPNITHSRRRLRPRKQRAPASTAATQAANAASGAGTGAEVGRADGQRGGGETKVTGLKNTHRMRRAALPVRRLRLRRRLRRPIRRRIKCKPTFPCIGLRAKACRGMGAAGLFGRGVHGLRVQKAPADGWVAAYTTGPNDGRNRGIRVGTSESPNLEIFSAGGVGINTIRTRILFPIKKDWYYGPTDGCSVESAKFFPYKVRTYAKIRKSDKCKKQDVSGGDWNQYGVLCFFRHGVDEVEQGPDGNWYLAGHAPTEAEPTSQSRCGVLEAQTGLTRAVRSWCWRKTPGASEYVKTTAQEIEALAEPLRTQEAGDDAGTV